MLYIYIYKQETRTGRPEEDLNFYIITDDQINPSKNQVYCSTNIQEQSF